MYSKEHVPTPSLEKPYWPIRKLQNQHHQRKAFAIQVRSQLPITVRMLRRTSWATTFVPSVPTTPSQRRRKRQRSQSQFCIAPVQDPTAFVKSNGIPCSVLLAVRELIVAQRSSLHRWNKELRQNSLGLLGNLRR